MLVGWGSQQGLDFDLFEKTLCAVNSIETLFGHGISWDKLRLFVLWELGERNFTITDSSIESGRGFTPKASGQLSFIVPYRISYEVYCSI